MARQVGVEEVTRQERKQDCGCGCGGDSCGAARQEVIMVGFPKGIAAKEGQPGQCGCDGSCGCRG
jgi:hypothetical protein